MDRIISDWRTPLKKELQQKKPQKINVAAAVAALTNAYLLQQLKPPFRANDLTVENHGGGAQTERRRFAHAALHERLQVRVQLQNGEHICQSGIDQAEILLWNQSDQPSGENMNRWVCIQPTYMLSDPVNEQHETHS